MDPAPVFQRAALMTSQHHTDLQAKAVFSKGLLSEMLYIIALDSKYFMINGRHTAPLFNIENLS